MNHILHHSIKTSANCITSEYIKKLQNLRSHISKPSLFVLDTYNAESLTAIL